MPIDNSRSPRGPQTRRTIDGFLGGASPQLPTISSRPKTIGALTTEKVSDVTKPSPSGNVSPKPTRKARKPLLSTDPETLAKQAHDRKWHRIRSRALRAALVAIAAIIVVGGLLLGKGYLQLHHVFRGGGTAVALDANVNPDELNGEGSGRINVLLLGIGGGDHEGPDLTDTMLVASINPVNNTAALLSIPRDLWVKMPNNYISNYQKINAAYESGKYEYLGTEDGSNSNQKAIDAGFKAVDGTVEQVLGIPINYTVLVNFQAFQQAVNTVGSVTINVPTELYDPTMAWANNGNPVIAAAGAQTMDGSKALMYVRSRETTSDFARTQRQRSVILALKQKVLTLGTLSNPLKISQLLSTFGSNVRTDISLKDANAMYSLIKNISNNKFKSLGLADAPNNFVTTGTEDNVSIVEPTAGLYNYSQIQSYVRNTLKDGYIAKENADIMILNGTTTPGLANTVASTLKSYGYRVGAVGNAPTLTYQKTVIVDLTGGKDKYTSHYLQNRLHAKAVETIPDKTIQPNGANFVIILGEDAANSS
ncbi:MAG TPA: LCP family protein [Candidatus Saccharimonadales bacterium]|nr:LCP family protein [Candidatus Saccharimonadales bacterium]